MPLLLLCFVLFMRRKSSNHLPRDPSVYLRQLDVVKCFVSAFSRGHGCRNFFKSYHQSHHIRVPHPGEQRGCVLSAVAGLAVDIDLFVQFDTHTYRGRSENSMPRKQRWKCIIQQQKLSNKKNQYRQHQYIIASIPKSQAF